ncbi:MAG TPA: GerMN domain-containing protein, partial [Naasia sp.]
MRAARAALAAALIALLAGCATIPVAGPVNEAGPIAEGEDLGFDFRPQGPAIGASPEEILSGFIAAGAGPQNNYEVARQFLTADFAPEWDPNAGTFVHSRATSTIVESDTSLRLLVPASGRVDGTGRYEEYGDQLPTELRFRLVQESGEWRIGEAPGGTVVARSLFDRLFAQRALYFYDPSFTYLVPDLRWFPATADAPTRIVEALLDGPADPLAAPVLVSAFPEGTTLARQSVTTTAGEAVVELSDEVVRADPTTRQRMQVQLARSLVGRNVVSVRISVDGSEPTAPVGGGTPILQPQVNPRPLVLRDGAFGFLVGDGVESVDGLSDVVEELAPSAAVFEGDTERLALLTATGVVAMEAGQDAVAVDERAGLIAPGLDSQGFVWTVPADSPEALRVTPVGGASVDIATPWQEASAIVSLGVSRDSTRLLVLLETPEGTRLRVHGIVRDGAGAPVALSADGFELVPAEGTPVAATWVSETAVGSLAVDANGVGAIVTQDVAGHQLDAVADVPGAVALVGGNGL